MKIPKYIEKSCFKYLTGIAKSEEAFKEIEMFLLKNGVDLWELEDDLYSPNSILRYNEPQAYMGAMRDIIRGIENEKQL